ncbi:hypothetical protein V5799_019995 [Amblyomma americanum]|uniref:Uncharacterized protein n=1 Tax=Amblyomma americanum TaxID=6943 RepID=A0AAQ4EV59_AMBAM
MRQVAEEGSAGGVLVHWDSSKPKKDEARLQTEEAGRLGANELKQGTTNRAEDEAPQGRNANGALDARPTKSEEDVVKEAVPLKAARARINMLAPSTPAATANPDPSTKSQSEESGDSFVVLRPKESVGDLPIQVSASANKSQEGQEQFAIGVTQAKTRGSIHLEGQIITPKTSKADLVHGFQMAAVGNVHHVHDTPQPPDWDANYPPHRQTSSQSVVTTQAATDPNTGTAAPSATSVAAETKLPVAEGQKVSAEPVDDKQQPLQTEAKHKLGVGPTPGRETFRASAAPLANVPSLGTITKVAASLRNEEERSTALRLEDLNPSGFIDSQVGGPFLPLQEYEESEAILRTLSVHSTGRGFEAQYVHPATSYTSAAAELAPYVTSSERLDRISKASVRSGLREEFVFSATTFGLTEKECQALPPVRGPGMSGSRVNLRPTNQMSEFGFSATTVGLTDRDRLAIASNQSLNKRAENISHSKSNKSELGLSSRRSAHAIGAKESRSNARTEFGFSATTTGLTEKDRLAIASNQSLNKLPEGISRSKTNKSEFSLTSGKSVRATGAQESRRNEITEFGFSATTIGLTEKDVQNLPRSRKSVQDLDMPVYRERSNRDTHRGFSATATALAEREREEFLPLKDVGRVSSGAGTAAGVFSHHSLRGRTLLDNEGEESSLEISAESGDLERSWAEKFKLNVSRERLQSSHGYGGYEASEACRQPSGSSTPVSMVRPVLSVIREESAPDIIEENFMARRGASQAFKVSSARELFGPAVPFEDVSLLNSFHNSNPATYNSSNPGQQIDDLCVERLSDEQRSTEASFGPPDRQCTVRFVEDAAAEWGSGADLGVQRHPGNSATTFPSARSMMDFETAYETPHNSIEAQSQLPTFPEARLVTVSTSSSITSEPDGPQINQELHYCEEPVTSTGLARPDGMSDPVASELPGNIDHPFGLAHDSQTAQWGPTAPFGEQVSSPLDDTQVVTDNENNFLFQNQEPTLIPRASVTTLRTESASKLVKPPYSDQFDYQIQGDAQDWLPYSSYREPPVYPQETYGTRGLGGFAAPFALPAPRARVRDVRMRNVEAFVATGGPMAPRKVLVRRNSPEFMRGRSQYGRLRPSTAGLTRKGRRLISAPWQQSEFCFGTERHDISATGYKD